MLTKKHLDNAVVEAKRFLEKAKLLKDTENVWGKYLGSKETGAVKRASMDLTRALADLRRGE